MSKRSSRIFVETKPEDQQYAIQCVNPSMRAGNADAAPGFGVSSNLPLHGGSTVMGGAGTARMGMHGGGMTGGGAGGDGGDDLQLLSIAHRALRGKYWIVILLGLMCGFGGAKLGIKLGKPVYRSEGMIRIAYRQAPVLKQADDNLPMEVFDAFLQSQKLLIGSRRLTEQAWADPQLQAMAAGKHKNIEDLGDIRIEQKSGADYLTLSLNDRDPEFAAAAIRAVVRAYESVFRAESDQFQQQRIGKLDEKQQELEKQLADKNAELNVAKGDEAYAELEKRRDAAAREMEQYRAMLTDINIALVMAQHRPGADGPGDAQQANDIVTAERAAINDPYLRNLMDQRMKAEEAIDALRLQGYDDKYKSMISAKQQWSLIQGKITKYMAEMRPVAGNPQPNAGPVAQTGPLALANRSIEDLKADEAGVKKLFDAANARMAELANKAEKSETLRLQIKDTTAERDQIVQRMHLLEIEGGLAAKLSVISYGEVPLSPYQDRRMIKAGMGGMAGLFFPACVFVAIGWLNQRFRYSGETEDAISKRTALLGIVPAVPERIRDPEQAATAAESVHHIRVMLQLRRQNAEGGVYMVTSSSASEGKTSITVALGMSYAASGCKTLIIDCDPVGRALTRGFTAERMSGFREALAQGEIQNFVREQTTGLCVLPVGDADTSTGWTVSPATIARLLSKAKREFDVILVDTGPILGSVVASVVAPAVDDVIFVVSRGAQRPRVERAIRYLDSIGAHVAGCVFNRAKVREYERSVSKSMSSPAARKTKLSMSRDQQLRGMQGFGPLVECVTAFVPRSNGHGD